MTMAVRSAGLDDATVAGRWAQEWLIIKPDGTPWSR
jgi:hypothetical protein